MDTPTWFSEPRLRKALRLTVEFLLVLVGIALWLAVFLLGALVDSAPYRASFAAFGGGLAGTVKSGALVMLTYTLTNVAILCMLACLLGAAAARARLGSDAEGQVEDRTAPRSSAVLRGFLVYLSLLAGVLIFGEDPAVATQKQYIRLAGFISLLGFVTNYRPELFARLLRRAGSLVEGSRGGNEARPEPKPEPHPQSSS